MKLKEKYIRMVLNRLCGTTEKRFDMDCLFTWTWWRFNWLNPKEGRLHHARYLYLFGGLYFEKQLERVTGKNKKLDLPCDWCSQTKETTIEEVWCEADPRGRLVRICKDCGNGCAEG